jgi:hypothetical protein
MMTNSPPEEIVFFPRSLPWDVGFDVPRHGGRELVSYDDRPSFISRLENLDPTTDEFLIDAGVRISPAAWKPLRTPPSLLPVGGLTKRGGESA